MHIDTAIRAQITQFHVPTYTIEPSAGFAQKVMDQAVDYEKQRRSRINLWFALVALAPTAIRQGWMLVRGDYVSVESLPFGHAIAQTYSALMSGFATYGFIAAGLILAFFVVGLPKWKVAEFKTSSK